MDVGVGGRVALQEGKVLGVRLQGDDEGVGPQGGGHAGGHAAVGPRVQHVLRGPV